MMTLLPRAARVFSKSLERMFVPQDLLTAARSFAHARVVPLGRGLSLRYEAAGDGPTPVLFVPDGLGAATTCDEQLAHFEDSPAWRALAIDSPDLAWCRAQRGTPTDADRGECVRQFVRTLDLDRPVLVGRSGGISTVVAYIRQVGHQRVKACVWVDEAPASTPMSWDTAHAIATLDAFIPMLFVVRRDAPRSVADWASRYGKRTTIAPLVRHASGPDDRPDFNAVLHQFLMRLS
jgi:pimeloyl-ACP methyl ester carboxylesterase